MKISRTMVILSCFSCFLAIVVGFNLSCGPKPETQVGFVTAEGTVGSQTITIGVNEKTQIISSATINLTCDSGAMVSFPVVIATNAVSDIPIVFAATVTPPTLGKATDIVLVTTSGTAKAMSQTSVTIQMSVSVTAAASNYSVVLTVTK